MTRLKLQLLPSLLKSYSIGGIIRLSRDYLLTKLFYSSARLIRQPVYIRGKDKIRWGHGFTTGVGVRMDAFSKGDEPLILIGVRVQINDYVHIGAIHRVEIGDDVLIASKVFISDHNHGSYAGDVAGSSPAEPPVARALSYQPVRLGSRVWIGEQACILPGVTIGAGSIIGAGSVVTRDVPENCIAVGNPAKVIKQYDASTGQWIRCE